MLFSLEINNEQFKVAISDTPEKREKGLSGIEYLGKRKGMLFIFEEPVLVKMVMREMNFDLDFIFLNKNWEILQLGSLTKDNTEGIISEQLIDMVLEINKGIIEELKLQVGQILKPANELKTHITGVQTFKTGGKFEMVGDKVYKIIEDDVKIEEGKMQVLNTKGEVVSNVKPGARIFSRLHTKKIIEVAKKNNFEDLGQLILAVFEKQDNQKQEYVENK